VRFFDPIFLNLQQGFREHNKKCGRDIPRRINTKGASNLVYSERPSIELSTEGGKYAPKTGKSDHMINQMRAIIDSRRVISSKIIPFTAISLPYI
jgi:hypothetical protein